jgi:uncharacterized membrane protein
MKLSDSGESRVRGYLYVLERSLRSAVKAELAADAVREVESHIRERVSGSDAMPNERDALERILTQLGTPTTVARAYSIELMMDEAAVGGRISAIFRSLFHVATTGAIGFFGAIGLFAGYSIGLSFLAIALLKPIFPNNVGIWALRPGGVTVAIGARFPAPDGIAPAGGYWLIPLCLLLGFGILVLMHRAARRWITSLRDRGRRSRTVA